MLSVPHIIRALSKQARTLPAPRADIEWAWAVGRVLAAAAAFVGTVFFLRGEEAANYIYVAASLAVGYGAVITVLLIRGRLRVAYWTGTVLDNLTVATALFLSVRSLAGSAQTNDLYLVLLPVIVVGVVRTGWLYGSLYVLTWLALFGLLIRHYYDPAGYDVQQLPVRLMFIGMTSFLAVRITARLQNESRKAERLQYEAEAIGDIGRLVGSSLKLSDVFPQAARALGKMVPADQISLLEFDETFSKVSISFVTHAPAPGLGPGAVLPFPQELLADLVARREGVLLTGDRLARALAAIPQVQRSLSDQVKSVAIAPVVAADKVVGLLAARSSGPEELRSRHLKLLCRVGAQIGGAIVNMRLYTQAVQLSEGREQTARLDAQNKELQRVSEAKSAFVSTVSHEMKTPLTSMVAFTDIMLRDAESRFSERDAGHLKAIKRNADMMTRLINDLNDISKIEAGKLEVAMETFDARDAALDVVSRFEPVLQARGQRVTLDSETAPAVISADRMRIIQVMSNLVSNASKYSQRGSTIAISLVCREGQLKCAVRDDGIGISAEDQARLFTPFFRSHESQARSQPGTGLGLLISKGIVEAHGGTIVVQSEPGHGTTATFHIPVAPPAQDINPAA